MSRCFSFLPYTAFLLGAVAVASGSAPKALAAPVDSGATARAITLDYADAPPPKAEISLSFGLFSEMFGITDAALQGLMDAAMRFANGAEAGEKAAVELTAEQVATAKKVIGMLRGSIQSLEVRVYEDAPNAVPGIRKHYSSSVEQAGWDRVLRAAEEEKQIQIAIRRDAGAIRGVFVMASEDDEAVVALLGCDLSPKKIRELTDTLTSAAFDLGLAKQLEKAVAELREELGR